MSLRGLLITWVDIIQVSCSYISVGLTDDIGTFILNLARENGLLILPELA